MSSAALSFGIPRSAYPERLDARRSWLDRQGQRLAGAVERAWRVRTTDANELVLRVEELGPGYKVLSPEELIAAARTLRPELRQRGFVPELVAHSFAIVREVAERSTGMRHFDVQLIGGWALLQGMVAEMETGEGKTLTATLAAGTAALAGWPTHVVTVNDYLASRDAEWMGPVYRGLGLTVGLIQHGMSPTDRRAAYGCDVTYCSNKELTFDYLKDRILLGRDASRVGLAVERLFSGAPRTDRLLLRGLCYAIVDEADSVLVDEARTPLIISGASNEDIETEAYEAAVALARDLERDLDFEIEEREKLVRLTEDGCSRLADLAEPLGGIWLGKQRSEDLVRQALTALHVFVRDTHYLVADDKVQIIDEYTGRLMADRSWEHGLHQLVQVKEGVEITGRQQPLARISYQRFFRRYLRLAGMSGTAREVSRELGDVYGLPTTRIPPHRPIRRQDLGEHVFDFVEDKWEAIVARIGELHLQGRPVLAGTRSVATSELLSGLLGQAGLPHQVLNARQDAGEAEVIAQAGQPGQITVATNMAGRGTDIKLGAGVVELGGLHVIATEYHEARRIDRQLHGRSGRQGDPGSFETFGSRDDEIFERHAGPLWSLLARSPRLARFAVRAAQWRAGRLHARIRGRLLRMDAELETMLSFSGPGE